MEEAGQQALVVQADVSNPAGAQALFEQVVSRFGQVDIIAAADQTLRRQRKLVAHLLALIAGDPVQERPGRSEPRARKRRGKNYQLSHPAKTQDGSPATSQPGESENLQISLLLAPFGTEIIKSSNYLRPLWNCSELL